MKTRGARLSRAQWREICAAYATSGITAAVFASRHNLNPRTLSWWKSELNRAGDLASGPCMRERFVEVVEDAAEASCVTTFRLGRAEFVFDKLLLVAWLVELIVVC